MIKKIAPAVVLCYNNVTMVDTWCLMKGRNVRVKKLIALVLCMVTVVSLVGCNTAAPKPQGPEVVEKKDFSRYAGIVEDPKTWYENFMALPIANENMTTDELRRLCVEAFKANLSFPWTPNATISYSYTLLSNPYEVSLPVGLAYSGLCYAATCPNGSRGNIWKVLNYYDLETGVVDIEAMGDTDTVVSNMTSACAYGALQAWNRVSNSHGLDSMGTYNQYDSNIVPVGPYTYMVLDYNCTWNSRTSSNEVIAVNGEEVMYESLAQMLPADGLYSASSYHVIMCSEKPVVVRDDEGNIDPKRSTVLVCEQENMGTHSNFLNYIQPNGAIMRPLGTVDRKYTFRELINRGYVPFTLKEFIGEDPVEPGEAWIGNETERLENGADLTAEEIFSRSVCGNYNPCTITVKVKSPDGTELVSYAPMLNSTPTRMSAFLTGCLYADRIAPYANGSNTIHIYVRLANGELIEAFHTTLKMA